MELEALNIVAQLTPVSFGSVGSQVAEVSKARFDQCKSELSIEPFAFAVLVKATEAAMRSAAAEIILSGPFAIICVSLKFMHEAYPTSKINQPSLGAIIQAEQYDCNRE
ncbi:hypothetical protein [Lentibacter sp. XHP0401]|uniref:hypothetical protein n=1 Tax=Lentibacter sp. XHP0401 TaxID=2984334 RepID=UPI0021E74148|nr:hypothetical protein [Lentibacter sp. XHP0401]MCV2894635.1 hypothetical protein [Lentibacter sp. XHP0401]